MNIYRLLLVLSVASVLASCKKYLEEPPKVQTDIQSVDQLQALIDNSPSTAYGGHNATLAYSTDDTEISTDLYKNYPTSVTLENLYYYVFDVNNIVNTASDPFWNAEYKRIFLANVILSNAGHVTGDLASKNRVKADAYFLRAYSYFNLVNYYCLPYAAGNLPSKGLPLKKSTIYSESLQPGTLKETYEQILADIEQSRSLLSYTDVQPSMRWRISKAGIDAFLSRFYLFTGDYDKSLQFANSALATPTAQLVDYKNIGTGVTATYSNPAAIVSYSALNDYAAVKSLAWSEFYFVHFDLNSSQWYIPSSNLIALYDQSKDLRYKLLMIPNGGRRFNVITPAQYRYTYFQDGLYLPSGPTIAEVLLNKAEALARKGDFSAAMDAVNVLRTKRMSNYVPLSASNKADALLQVLQERRRELPFTFRWVDIRRFSVNDDTSDDVTVTHTFFRVGEGSVDVNTLQAYTLPVKSPRYQVPINGIEINASRGQIKQNDY